MHLLGYTCYVGQGGDMGASVTERVTTLPGPGDDAPPVSKRNRPA
jgi:hypothetical protein